MSESTFSDPIPAIYRDEDPSSSDSPTHDDPSLDQDATSSVLDLNDPNLLLQEVTGADPNVNPYAAPPPPPDGFYRLKLKQVDVKDDKGQKVRFAVKAEMSYPGGGQPGTPVKNPDGSPKRYIATALEGRIQQVGRRYDNIPVFDRFMDSRVDRNGGCPIIYLLQALKVKLPPKYNLKTLMDLTNQALASEPEVDAQLAWEGSLDEATTASIKSAQQTNKDVKRPRNPVGMHRFPQVDGKYVPDMQVEVAGVGKVNFHAQAKIVAYAPVGSKTGKK